MEHVPYETAKRIIEKVSNALDTNRHPYSLLDLDEIIVLDNLMQDYHSYKDLISGCID